MENLKVYISYGEEKDIASIMVTDETVYEKNNVMRGLQYKQFIFTEEVMLKIIEEYFINRGYNLDNLTVSDDEETLDTKSLISEIKKDRVMFYKLWQTSIGNISKVVLEKDDDILEVFWNGRYTYSDYHRDIIQNVVREYLKPVE